MRRVLGADISKSKINYCIVSEEGEICSDGRVKNDVAGFETLLNLINEYQAEVIFEATGVYSKRYQYFLELQNIGYVRMNPLKAKKEMDTLRVTKNDVIDARQLALLQLTKNYTANLVEDEAYLELRRQNRYYQEIANDGATAKNRLHKCLQETFSEIEQLFKGDHTNLYKIIVLIPHADMIKGKTEQEVAAMIQTVYGTATKRGLNTARRLLVLADQTGVSVPLNSCLIEQTRHWAQKVMDYQSEKEKILDTMSDFAEGMPEIEIIESIPGFGRASSLGLVAEFGDIKRFATPQKMNAFIGIDLRFNDSGQVHTTGFATKRGSAIARKILFKTALGVIAASSKGRPSNIANWYRRRSSVDMQNKKKLLVGAMARVLKLIHHLVLNQELFKYQIN